MNAQMTPQERRAETRRCLWAALPDIWRLPVTIWAPPPSDGRIAKDYLLEWELESVRERGLAVVPDFSEWPGAILSYRRSVAELATSLHLLSWSEVASRVEELRLQLVEARHFWPVFGDRPHEPLMMVRHLHRAAALAEEAVRKGL